MRDIAVDSLRGLDKKIVYIYNIMKEFTNI